MEVLVRSLSATIPSFRWTKRSIESDIAFVISCTLFCLFPIPMMDDLNVDEFSLEVPSSLRYS